MKTTEIVAPNFKRRLSGVTSTIVQLLPLQEKSFSIAALGPGLPENLPKLPWWQVPGLLRKPLGRQRRVWHARRNVEMLAGIVLRDILRAPLKLVFTSAAQRHHRRFTRWLLTRMDRVIATNRRSASFLHVPSIVIMHGVDTQSFRPANGPTESFTAAPLTGEFAIGCFGRIRHQKGTDLFVDAMVDLLPDHPQWTAIITGRVTLEHRSFMDGLRSRIEEAGLESRIVFLGEVDDIASWYRRLSLYVAPSRQEGFGLTPLEAMASGVPVVASDAGAYQELVEDGVTGRVVPAGSLSALTDAICPFLQDSDMREAAAAASLKRARDHFALEREAAAIAAVYRDLLGSPPPENRNVRSRDV